MPTKQLTCVITGATRGIGAATAMAMAENGWHVILLARNAASGQEACRTIQQEIESASVESEVADLADQAMIRHAAARLRTRYPKIHLLINNAAIVTQERQETDDGIEMQLAVNHLAPFLLTHLLLPCLEAGSPSRIVIVASQVERAGRINFEDLMGRHEYHPYAAYRQSKLANMLFCFELTRRLGQSGTTVNCLHPGVVRTGLLESLLEAETEQSPGRWSGRLERWNRRFRAAARPLLRRPPAADWALTPNDGARCSTYVATAPELATVTGQYFVECRPAEPSAQSQDRELAQRLWQVSTELTGLKV